MKELFSLNNKQINTPPEYQGSTVELTFSRGKLNDIKPVSDIGKFTFTNDALRIFLEAIEDKGYYKKIPYTFQFGNVNITKGYIADYEYYLDRDKVKAKLVDEDSIDGLLEQMSSLTSLSLSGKYKTTDIPFIIEEVNITQKLLFMSGQLFIMSYLLAQQTYQLIEIIADAVEASDPLNTGEKIALIAKILAQVIFVASTLASIINLAKDIKELILPKKRTNKGVSLHELLRVPLDHLGYEFITNISEMDNVIHWESGNINNNEGHPVQADKLYNCIECFEEIAKKYNASIFIKDKKVHFYTLYDEFFFQNTPFQLPKFVDTNFVRNYKEQKGGYSIDYATGSKDDWPYKEFTGHSFLAKAESLDNQDNTLTGIDNISYDFRLTSRKSSLNLAEKAYEKLATSVNNVLDIFGGSATLGLIPSSIGFAKISSENIGTAKLVYLKNGKIPSNHRDLLSAKSDWEKYHSSNSLILNKRARHLKFSGVQIPFTQESYFKTLQSGYITDTKGRKGQFESIKWNTSRDFAIVDFYLEEDFKVDLKHTYYEPTS